MAQRSETLSLILNAKDKASKQFGQVGKASQKLRKNLNALPKAIFNIKTAFAGLGLALVAKSFLDTATSFERFQTSLETITGSAEKAKKAMEWITEFTAQTPYELEEVTKGFTKLSAYGLDPTTGLLRVLGDTASAMAKDLNQAVEMMADAVTGEFERLKEFGIRASQQGEQVTFTWKQAGEQMVLNAEKTQTGIEKALIQILESRFKDAMARYASTWAGMLSNLKDQWTLFQKAVMEAGVFEYIKGALSLLLEKIKELKRTGKLAEWARNMATGVIEALRGIAVAAAAVIDTFKHFQMIWEGLKGAFGVFAAAIVAGLYKILSVQHKVAQALGFEGIAAKYAVMVREVGIANGFFNKMIMDSAARLNEFYDKGYLVTTVTKFFDEAAAKAKELAAETTKVAVATDDLSTAQEKMGGKAGAGVGGLIKKNVVAAMVSAEAVARSTLTRLQAATETALAELQTAYDRGEMALVVYFDRRTALVEEQYKKEMRLLEASAEAEVDPTKRLAIEDEIFQKQEAHKRTLLELTGQEREAEERMAEARLRATEMLELARVRVKEQAAVTLEEQYALERERLLMRQAEELALFQEQTHTEMELEALKMTHKEELRQKDLELERRYHTARLSMAQNMAGGMADAFDSLYTLTGKRVKELFYLQKAAAIAEATIATYKAATEALDGTWWGVAMAAVMVAKGLANVAVITAQKMASGGMIGGWSPHPKADNVLIAGTAGEFMQPVSTVRYYGKDAMEALRRRLIPREIFTQFLSLPKLASPRPAFALAAGGSVAEGPGGAAAGGVGREEGEGSLNIYNVIDPGEMLDRALATRRGRRSIINVMGEEQFEVKQALSE